MGSMHLSVPSPGLSSAAAVRRLVEWRPHEIVRERPAHRCERLLQRLGLSLVAFLASTLVAFSACAADRELDAFVSEVIARNPGLKARVLERANVEREASAAGLWPDPQVSVMVDNLPERMGGEMPMVRYQVSQMVPWPGKL